MNRLASIRLLTILSSLALLLDGCVIKQARVPTRHFVLAPIPASEHSSARAQPSWLEVTVVRMPSYLLRDSLVIRKSPTEVDYLETALWAQRLDLSFRNTLAQNLSLLVASDPAYLSTSQRQRLGARVSVNVAQFDVDTEGQGTLIAKWRLTVAGVDEPMKNGQIHLIRSGLSPRANPQAIATTLSALIEEFSRELASDLRDGAG